MNKAVRSKSREAALVVYVVDDDTGVLGSLRFLLETDGFQVRTFRSGEALLNLGTIGGVDCFVFDYKMPSMSGIDLASVLRKREIATPIILMTGYFNENITVKAAAAGISHVLHKPLLESCLATTIRDAIEAERRPAPDSLNLRESTEGDCP
jgi:FixJ family two-component response regulator